MIIDKIYEKPDRELVWQNPRFAGLELRGDKAIISFDTFSSELEIRAADGQIGGFAIVGKDRKFRWANVKLQNGKIMVWHETIEQPVAVRYGWSDNPARVNLFNAVGLPFIPFRTDSW